MAISVLIVDDISRARDSIAYLLEKSGYKFTKAASGTEALNLLEQQPFDVALIDVKMAQMDGFELLQRIRARWPNVAVILMTAYASIPAAVEAMKMGASTYLEKPFERETLFEAIKRALAEYGRGHGDNEKGSPFQEIVTGTQEVMDAIELAKRNAANDKPILILGEIGTGREALARAVHASSPRAAAPFLPVRCSTGATNLEEELFGTQGGGQGRLVEANAGTLFLDEVGDLSLELQGRLLRFLQDGEVARGSGPAARSNARVIASSSEDLEAMIAAGEFRQDVYLRLKAITLRLPPLRDRRSDIPKLVTHYLKKAKPRGAPAPRFSREATKLLMAHTFPGNLKELEDVVEQAAALAKGGEVTEETLSRLNIAVQPEGEAEGSAMRTRVESEEKKAIEEALRRNPRNLKQTARDLNISRTTLWRKMKKYGLDAR